MTITNNHKIVLLGESTVGKTSFANMIKNGFFVEEMEPTIGCEFFGVTHLYDNTNVRFLIWDTAGHEKFKTFTSQFSRKASIALIFYDLTSTDTIKSLDSWLDFIPEYTDVLIVPSKSDLYPENYVLPNLDIYNPKNCNVHYSCPISSKTGNNIDAILDQMAKILIGKNIINNSDMSSTVAITNKISKKSCCF
jgi:Ras-related protein Rab-6A